MSSFWFKKNPKIYLKWPLLYLFHKKQIQFFFDINMEVRNDEPQSVCTAWWVSSDVTEGSGFDVNVERETTTVHWRKSGGVVVYARLPL